MTCTPSIYVASLADYNAGRLHGRWIDASQDPDDIASEVEEMLDEFPEPGGEEWAIHDYEGFPGMLDPYEWHDFKTVSAVAKAIETHGSEVMAACLGYVGAHYIDPETLSEEIRKSYQGHYPSLGDYAAQLAEDIEAPGCPYEAWPLNCIDWEAAGEALEGVWTQDSANGVHVFRSL